MRRRWTAAATLGLVCALSACGAGSDTEGSGGSQVDGADSGQVEEVAAEARGYIDEVVAALGQDPEVRQDTLTDCVPGDTDSGQELIYAVHVTTEGAKDAILESLREDWVGRGWSAEPGGAVDLQLQKDTYSIAVTISETSGRAAVIGGGGCVGG
jgi:hypothetical protein